MPKKKDKQTKEIIEALNKPTEESLINSPAIEPIMHFEINQEDEPYQLIPSIEARLKKIQYLRNQIRENLVEIHKEIIELSNELSTLNQVDYYLKQGIRTILQGIEYLKDHDEGKIK